MAARDYWDRMLIYFGIAEELDEQSDRMVATQRREVATVSHGDEWDDLDVARPASRRGTARAAARRPTRMNTGAGGVGFVPPRTFNDAQKIADQYKRGLPVIVNLQATEGDLAKRIIDFASGLTYGLDGGMQRIADRVFLLTPAGMDVTAEDRAALMDSEFFNQS